MKNIFLKGIVLILCILTSGVINAQESSREVPHYSPQRYYNYVKYGNSDADSVLRVDSITKNNGIAYLWSDGIRMAVNDSSMVAKLEASIGDTIDKLESELNSNINSLGVSLMDTISELESELSSNIDLLNANKVEITSTSYWDKDYRDDYSDEDVEQYSIDNNLFIGNADRSLYVSCDYGNDLNDGFSLEKAKETISSAILTAKSMVPTANDQINIYIEGNFSENISIDSSYINIIGNSSSVGTVDIDANCSVFFRESNRVNVYGGTDVFVEIDFITSSYPFFIYGKSNVYLKSKKIHGNGAYGITVLNTTDTVNLTIDVSSIYITYGFNGAIATRNSDVTNINGYVGSIYGDWEASCAFYSSSCEETNFYVNVDKINTDRFYYLDGKVLLCSFVNSVIYKVLGTKTEEAEAYVSIAGEIYGGGGGTFYHDSLLNRNLANQHPISAITGLETSLDSKLSSESDPIFSAHLASGITEEDTTRWGSSSSTDDQTATEVPITDVGGYYNGSDVEAMGQEIGESISVLSDSSSSYDYRINNLNLQLQYLNDSITNLWDYIYAIPQDTINPVFINPSLIYDSTSTYFTGTISENSWVYTKNELDGVTSSPYDSTFIGVGYYNIEYSPVSPETAYDFWYKAKDESGNESTPVKIDYTTLASPNPNSTYVEFTSNSRVFEGAVGYGTDALGAYELYAQTGNINDLPTILTVDTLYAGILQTGTNSGSLEWCIDVATGPRAVIFEVSGIIDYRPTGDKLTLIDDDPNKDYLSIYGQTAPGNGITVLGNYWLIRNSNVLIQHIRFRMGDDFTGTTISSDLDNITIGSTPINVVLDHCSFSWSQDESINGYANNFTMSNCFVYNPLHYSRHVNESYPNDPEAHGYAILLEGHNNTLYNNVIYRSAYRNPAIGTGADNTLIINNVMYNPAFQTGLIADGGDIIYVNNYVKQMSGYDYYNELAGDLRSGVTSIYATGNWCQYRSDNPGASESSLFRNTSGVTFVGSPFTDLSDFSIRSTSTLIQNIFSEVGAIPWNRDYHDSINIVDAINEEGGVINSPDSLPARAYNDGADGDYGDNGNMTSGHDWSSANQTLIINSSTYTLNADCNNITEVLTEINSILPAGFEAVKHPETNYVILQTTTVGSGVSFTLSGTACSTLGMDQKTYYGSNGDGGKYPDYFIEYTTHTLPANPHYDDDEDGYSNFQEWVKAFETGTSPTSNSLLNGLVSYWSLDQQSGNALDYRGSNDGTVTNTDRDSVGISNYSYSFDGDDYITILSASGVNFDPDNDAFSISFWIKRNVGTTLTGYIISKYASGATQYGIYAFSNDITVIVGQTTTDVGITISDYNWNHFVLAMAGDGTGTLYLNGVADDTQIIAGALTNSSDIMFGGRAGGFYYVGLLDEIAFYYKELSSGEVLQLYNSGAGLPYPFE
jgi:hypothetical protein